jgi:hypothetical protein
MKRWPIIRHVRAIWLAWQVERHYRAWAKLGMLPSYRDRDAWAKLGMLPSCRDRDDEMLRRIWRGEA